MTNEILILYWTKEHGGEKPFYNRIRKVKRDNERKDEETKSFLWHDKETDKLNAKSQSKMVLNSTDQKLGNKEG
jgi:hypothetical protein